MVKPLLTKKQKQGAASYKRGLWAETVCSFYLFLKGYKLLARRYNTNQGEIDLIAKRKNNVVFIEVKARPNSHKAAEAISQQQQARLRRAASAYLSGRSSLANCNQRFDVMLVLPWRLPIHLENAF